MKMKGRLSVIRGEHKLYKNKEIESVRGFFCYEYKHIYIMCYMF